MNSYEQMLLRDDPTLYFAGISNEELFRKDWIFYADEKGDEASAALGAERAKRTAVKEAEKARIEQERLTKLHATKSAILYSDQLAQEICERVSAGELLINICADNHMPLPKTVRRWLNEHKDFAQLLKASIDDRLFIFEEETIKFADDISKDVLKNEKPNTVSVMRAKVQIDIRLRHLKAYNSKRWGDSVTVTNVDASEDFSGLDDVQIEERIADLERKTSTVRGTVGCDIGSYREVDNVTQLHRE